MFGLRFFRLRVGSGFHFQVSGFFGLPNFDFSLLRDRFGIKFRISGFFGLPNFEFFGIGSSIKFRILGFFGIPNFEIFGFGSDRVSNFRFPAFSDCLILNNFGFEFLAFWGFLNLNFWLRVGYQISSFRAIGYPSTP